MPQPSPPDRSRRSRRRPARRPARPDGLWLYGIHAVLAAVANPRRRVRRLLATEATLPRLRAAAAAAPVARPEVEAAADRRSMEALLPPGAVHQGMAALVEPLAEVALEDLLADIGEAPRARLVVLDQASDPRNVGAVVRSAAAFSVAAVVTQDRHAPQATGALAKAAAGGLERVPLVPVVNLARTLRRLQAAGFCCVGLDAEAEATLATSLPAGRVALVLGSEGHGLRRLVRESCDLLARIEIAPESGSLNLSAAAAIGLYALAQAPGPMPER